jgi:uncharacterized membrane protein YphA (DoxX/SURF4 family)
MSKGRGQCGLIALQWSLGIVILIEAILFVLPSAAHEFSRTHMPAAIRMVLGWGEIVGCIFLLIPKTTVRGAWLLVGIFALAIAIHLLHGLYNVGNLVIYIAAAAAVATGRDA